MTNDIALTPYEPPIILAHHQTLQFHFEQASTQGGHIETGTIMQSVQGDWVVTQCLEYLKLHWIVWRGRCKRHRVLRAGLPGAGLPRSGLPGAGTPSPPAWRS